MPKNRRWRMLVGMTALLMLVLFSAMAETNTSSLEEMEKTMLENFSPAAYQEFLAACARQKGEDFAREKAIFYYNLYPDNIDMAWGILMRCDPFSQANVIIEAGTRIIGGHELPAYTEDMPNKPHEADVGYYSGVYMSYVYAYYQLEDQEQLIKAADWLFSYAGYNEERFADALLAYDCVVFYFDRRGNDEKALHYAKRVKELLDQYQEQYPDTFEKFAPEYESLFIPILEKHARDQGRQGE